MHGIKRFPLWVLVTVIIVTVSSAGIPFRYRVIDHVVGHRQVADVDGDGYNDIIALNQSEDRVALAWYRYPNFTRHILAQISSYKDFGHYRSCDMELGDVDGDGDPDLIGRIGLNDDIHGVNVWFENPGPKGDPAKTWKRHDIGESHYIKDIEVADFDNNGLLDVAARATAAKLHLYFQKKADVWVENVLDITHHDGMDAGDIDRDGDVDLALNGYWLENPDDPVAQKWIQHDFDIKWYTQKTGETGKWYDNNSKVCVADMDQDGCLDILVNHSENKGFPVSWYRAPLDPRDGAWQEHLIGQINYCHSLNVADFDNDGDPDVMAAEMPRWEAYSPVVVFINEGGAMRWTEQLLSDKGNYSAAIGDLGNDGDVDIIGLRSYNVPPIEIWENLTSDTRLSLDQWTYILVDSTRTRYDGKTQGGGGWFGLAMGDLTGDGYDDIVSGKWVYRNPGTDMTAEWTRTTLADSFDAVLVVNVDDDAYADFIALKCDKQFWFEARDAWCSSWKITQINTLPVCNHGTGSQGYNLAQIVPGGKPEILLTGVGIYYLIIPEHPETGEWPSVVIQEDGSNGEWVSAGDMDGDGDPDVCAGFLLPTTGKSDPRNGVAWWENPGDGEAHWTKHAIGITQFHGDKFIGADVNGDGRKDMVVTEERYPGLEPDASLYWFEAPDDPKQTDWKRHTVVTEYSLNNLDVADLDSDGDPDIVTCEHKGTNEQLQIWENDGQANFRLHVIDRGKESHLGAILNDMDGDGDLDIVSIAWEDFRFLHLWRNDAITRKTAL